MDLELSTPFSLAQTFAAARAVLFSPNSTTVYRLPSNLMIIPRLMSAVFAIYPVNFLHTGIPPVGGKSKAKTAPGQDLLARLHQMVDGPPYLFIGPRPAVFIHP